MSVCLDRFAQGLPDPQEAKIMCHCPACGNEIYEGEDVYVIDDGDIIHADWDCLLGYINPEVKTVEEALGVKR